MPYGNRPTATGAWSLEKQRRSRIDWFSIVPEDVAHSQVGWERNKTVVAMRQTGTFTFRAIGDLFGLTQERIRQMEGKGLRRPESPVSIYFRQMEARGIPVEAQKPLLSALKGRRPRDIMQIKQRRFKDGLP